MLTELKNIGLSDREARVYLAMLELGPAAVLDIAAKSGVNRPTTYMQLEALKKKGLVSTQTRGKKQLFIAESPSQIEHLLAIEEKRLEQKRDELKKILPELSAMFNLGEEKPVVRYFEGREGLLAMQEEFLKTKEKSILAISSVDDVLRIFPKHIDTYTPRRIKKGIHSRLIYTSKNGELFPRTDKKLLRETKFLPPQELPFSADITIYGRNIAISSLKGKIGGTVITDSEIANFFKGIFALLWDIKA
jgi:sugar-specific transcriptional regulator TrmB